MGCVPSKSDPAKKGQDLNNDGQLPSKEKIRLQELTSKANIKDMYVFTKILGTGGFAQVKQASLKNDKTQKYAIKIIDKEKIKNKFYVLIREVEILMKLDHPNIIKFHEIYEDTNFFYIVQEYCGGGELLQRIVKTKQLDQKVAALIIKKIMSAVNHMHLKGVAHRDLKPENVLFASEDENAEIKIIDFGLSNKYLPQTNLTTMVGTPLYVSPQVIDGIYNESCDIWSIGIILYILLSGVPPFYSENKNQIFDMIQNEDPQFIDPLWQRVDPQAIDLIKKLLVKDEKGRITIKDALHHPWLKIIETSEQFQLDKNKTEILEPKILQNLKNFHGYPKLKQYVIRVVINTLTGPEIKELTDVFREIDVEDTGMVSITELKDAMAKFKIDIKQQELDELFNLLDETQEHEKKISYTTFMQATLDTHKYLTKDRISALFRQFDIGQHNCITADSLMEVMKRHGESVNEEEVQNMIKEVDIKNEGKITLETFKKLMLGDAAHPDEHH